MMGTRWSSLAVVALGLLLWALPVSGKADYTQLAQQVLLVEIEGIEIVIPYTPSIELVNEPNVLRGNLRVEADLGALQSTVPALIRTKAMETDEECGDRLDIGENLALRPTGGPELRLDGTVRYEKWYCTYAKIPEFKGLKVIFKNRRTSKSLIVRQSAKVSAGLTPLVIDGGRRIVLDGEATSVDADHGLLQPLVDLLNLDDELLDLVSYALRDALRSEEFALAMPEEVLRAGVRFEEVGFYDRGAGQLGLRIDGVAELTQEDFGQLLGELLAAQ